MSVLESQAALTWEDPRVAETSTLDRRPISGDATPRPPLMNVGYWGRGAVTAHEAQLELIRLLAGRLPALAEQRVLDISCGVGGAAGVLVRDYGAHVDAVGAVRDQVERARAYAAVGGLGGRLRFHQADATDLPFPPQTFDAVFSLEAARTVVDKPAFLSELYRVLKPGGRVVLGDMTVTAGGASVPWVPLLGLDLVTARSWLRMGEAAGLGLVEHRLIGSAVYPGYRRWMMLTARERRRAMRASAGRRDGIWRWAVAQGVEAWLAEYLSNRSIADLSTGLWLWDYLVMVAERPAARRHRMQLHVADGAWDVRAPLGDQTSQAPS